MGRKQRGHRPPQQGFQQVPQQVPVIQDPQQRELQAQMQIKAKVEGLAATIFTNNVKPDLGTEHFERLAESSIDASLILARELWGVEAQRQKKPVRPSNPPRVITDDDEEDAAEE